MNQNKSDSYLLHGMKTTGAAVAAAPEAAAAAETAAIFSSFQERSSLQESQVGPRKKLQLSDPRFIFVVFSICPPHLPVASKKK